jgi:hypothetical protein
MSLLDSGLILPLRSTWGRHSSSHSLEEQRILAIYHDDRGGLAERLVRSCGLVE